MVVILGAVGIKETRRDCGLEGWQRPPGRGSGGPLEAMGVEDSQGAGRNSESTRLKHRAQDLTPATEKMRGFS